MRFSLPKTCTDTSKTLRTGLEEIPDHIEISETGNVKMCKCRSKHIHVFMKANFTRSTHKKKSGEPAYSHATTHKIILEKSKQPAWIAENATDVANKSFPKGQSQTFMFAVRFDPIFGAAS